MDFREARVQYGDLNGKSAIDGYESPPLSKFGKIANVPDTHLPIGFSIYAGGALSPSAPVHSDIVYVHVAAVEKEAYGDNIQAIMDSAKRKEIKAQLFYCEIKLQDLFKYIKRLHITAINRGLIDTHIECESY